MDAMTEKTIEALETLPDSFRESVAAYVIEQAEKYRALKAAIDEGMADVEAGRVREWNSEEFLQRARSAIAKPNPRSSNEDRCFGSCER